LASAKIWPAASIPARGCRVYSPWFQSGSCSIASISILRHTRLRPVIADGRQARPIAASIIAGHFAAHMNACMQPIDVPIISRR
jgi:hypothetical protein